MPLAEIETLVERGDARALAELAESSDKETRKAARRGLPRLRSRGVKVPAVRPGPGLYTPKGVEEAAEVPCLATPVDSIGENVLCLVRPHDGGGLEIHVARVHEEHGILSFESGELARKAYREWSVPLRETLASAEVPWRYARAELEAAYQVNLAMGRAAPADFLRERVELGKAEPFETHPALALWPTPPPAQEEAILALAETPECRPWTADSETVSRVRLRLEEIGASQLLVSEAQREEARLDAVRKAMQEYFESPQRRALMRKRLLDCAYLVHQKGPSRVQNAEAARAAAEEFAPEGLVPAEGRFARRFFERIFTWNKVKSEPEEESPGLIVTP